MARRASDSPTPNLSKAELAEIKERFRQRMAEREASKRRGGVANFAVIARIVMAVTLIFIVGAILLRDRFTSQPVAPPPPPPAWVPVPVLGEAARLPLGSREVADAQFPILAGLADGSSAAQASQRQFALDQRLPVAIENSIGMRFRLIPPGTFVMGSSRQHPDHKPDEEEHVAEITRAFYLGQYEVTQAQWMAVMGPASNPSHFRQETPQHPVEEVSWREAVNFLYKLAASEGLPHGAYTLPDEIEWEYACRAGTQTTYHFGDDAGALRYHALYRDNGGKGTGPVGQFLPNAWGLYDMHGNVWEWCRNDFYYYLSKIPDPLRKSLRGGNWSVHTDDCRSASRFRYPPDSKGNILGFRVMRVLTEATMTPRAAPETPGEPATPVGADAPAATPDAPAPPATVLPGAPAVPDPALAPTPVPTPAP